MECNNLTAFSDTGDISLDKVVAKEKFSLKVDTGDIKFSKADAGEILAETDTGNISGTLLTDKIFIARTDTGKVDVPETESGGKCKVTTDTGDIKITII